MHKDWIHVRKQEVGTGRNLIQSSDGWISLQWLSHENKENYVGLQDITTTCVVK
jgi:hypothetical protein